MKRNTMQNHIRAIGSRGLFTWNAGLTVEQAQDAGLAEGIERSYRHEFKPGEVVRIRGTDEHTVVERVNGVFLTLASYGDRGFKTFYRIAPPHGRYSYGHIEIYKSHVEPVGGFL